MLQHSVIAHGMTPIANEFLQIEKVRGEKQWQAWAQDLEDFSIKQTGVANTRIPYASTLQLNNLVQLDTEKKVRGEKQWNAWAQDLEDFGIKQTTAANVRIPYKSSLLQMEEQEGADKVRGEKQWNAWAQDLEDFGEKQNTKANTRLPYYSNLQLEDDAKPAAAGKKLPVRGEKQW